MRKEKSQNCYYPNFLYMELATTEKLSYLCRYPISEEVDAAFLHEYVHYLQDITTISGYSNICVVCDRIRMAVTSKDKKLNIPIDYESILKHNIKANAIYQKKHIGDGRIKHNGIDIPFPDEFSLFIKDVDIREGHRVSKKQPISFTLDFNYNGIEQSYQVGEYCISESMAYLIENHIYPGILPEAPDFPYKVVDKIIEGKFPFLNNIEIKVALCDVALMFQFPGRAFYLLCQELADISRQREINFIDIYNLGYSTTFAEKLGVKNRDNFFLEMNRLAKKTFQDYFIMIPIWKDIIDQLTVIFDNAVWLRKYAPFFIIDILRGKEINRNNPFKCTVTKLIGALCIKTDAHELYHFIPELDIRILKDNPYNYRKKYYTLSEPMWVNYIINKKDYFNGLIEPDLGLLASVRMIYNILFKNGTLIKDHSSLSLKCELFDWCKDSFNRQQIKDITSDGYNCAYSPWENVKDKSRLDQCAFGRLWSAWRLDKKKLR